MKPNSTNENDSTLSFAQAESVGLALGAGIRTALGVAMHDVALGLATGAGVSVALAAAFRGRSSDRAYR